MSRSCRPSWATCVKLPERWLVGQPDTQILELVMDGFLDLNAALP